jgi:ribosome-binding factor A
VDALNHAAGFIARELGARMRIRAVPSLKFTLDNSIEYSVRISEILKELHDEDGKE